jgi:hypothetical protein
MRYGWSRLLILVATICFSQLAFADDGNPVHSYTSSNGQIEINFRTHTTRVLGRTIKFQDCSDTKYWCVESDVGGPSLTIAKHCNDNQPIESHGPYRTEWIALVHPGWIVIKDSRSPDYAFLVNFGRGVREIYYDFAATGLIRNAGSGKGIDMDEISKFGFKKSAETNLFSCE